MRSAPNGPSSASAVGVPNEQVEAAAEHYGGPRDSSLLEANDVVDAHVCELGELLTAQARHATAGAAVQADELRRNAGAACPHEFPELTGAGHGSIVTAAVSLVRAIPGSLATGCGNRRGPGWTDDRHRSLASR